jgi:hypothetical protein
MARSYRCISPNQYVYVNDVLSWDPKTGLYRSRMSLSKAWHPSVLIAHYPALKKGDRILVIGFEDRNRKVSRKAMLDGLKDPNRKPKPRVIFEATVHSPVGHRVKKNQWVGDGYEDVKVSTFSYAEGGFIITPYDSASMAMVKIP